MRDTVTAGTCQKLPFKRCPDPREAHQVTVGSPRCRHVSLSGQRMALIAESFRLPPPPRQLTSGPQRNGNPKQPVYLYRASVLALFYSPLSLDSDKFALLVSSVSLQLSNALLCFWSRVRHGGFAKIGRFSSSSRGCDRFGVFFRGL